MATTNIMDVLRSVLYMSKLVNFNAINEVRSMTRLDTYNGAYVRYMCVCQVKMLGRVSFPVREKRKRMVTAVNDWHRSKNGGSDLGYLEKRSLLNSVRETDRVM